MIEANLAMTFYGGGGSKGSLVAACMPLHALMVGC